MNKITNVYAREILDSRGNPTIEVELTLNDEVFAVASVPSGASTGSKEALELRDNDKDRYLGKGVLKAVNNVNTIIRDNIVNKSFDSQRELDYYLISLDGTANKSKLGANAILGVSLAYLKASAIINGKELYEYLGSDYTIPRCMMNILNGGCHANNNLDIQEFMIIPSKDDYKENLRMGSEIFHNLDKILKENNLSCGVGDEGGFAPNISSTREALDLVSDAVKRSGYVLGSDVYLGLDVAASEFYKDNLYHFEGKDLTSDELINYFLELVREYPIISIEDLLAEDDYEGWKKATSKLSNIQLVGDDLFVTNKKLLEYGIENNMANAILIKLNQIGTVTETLETIKLAKEHGYKTIISHRSGETDDTYIADFAVGLNAGQIKTGSMSRMDRICKYNRLLRIDEDIKK